MFWFHELPEEVRTNISLGATRQQSIAIVLAQVHRQRPRVIASRAGNRRRSYVSATHQFRPTGSFPGWPYVRGTPRVVPVPGLALWTVPMYSFARRDVRHVHHQPGGAASLGLRPRHAHPYVAFFRPRQDNRTEAALQRIGSQRVSLAYFPRRDFNLPACKSTSGMSDGSPSRSISLYRDWYKGIAPV